MFNPLLNTLKGLILFAKEQNIPHFRYKDFTFDLSSPNPNQAELQALKEEVAKLKAVVNQLTFKDTMSNPQVFNRGELLAQRLAGNK